MADPVEVAGELRRRPLPDPSEASDKHDRGTVLIVGGSRETPGSLILAGMAALRVGAGRIQLAVAASCAAPTAVAVPEARVIPLQETADGAVHPGAAAAIDNVIAEADVVLVGTGALDTGAAAALVRNVVPLLERAALVVDAGGLAAIDGDPRLVASVPGGAVLIPNVGEQSLLPGDDSLSAADATGAVVAIRGVETQVSAPGGPVYVDCSGNSGLAFSGSGDVFAGVLAGLCSRGTDPLTATLWATAIHGRAGERCAERIGPVGYVARDLLTELPGLLVECAN